LTIQSLALPFETVPYFGGEDLYSRLDADYARRVGFPLLDVENPVGFSRSALMNTAGVVECIHHYNPRLPAPEPDSLFVVTGQQAGLLTGPLYTFWKAASAILLSQALRQRLEKPVVPLFWIASEDHDVLEVNHVTLLGRKFVWRPEGVLQRGNMPQVADISLDSAREPLLAFLRDSLPATEFTEWLLEGVAGADYTNYATAFRSWMEFLFAGDELRLIDPIVLRRFTSPVLAALVEKWTMVTAAFQQGLERLHARGYAPPLDAPGLFEILEGRRVPIGISGAGVEQHGEVHSLRDYAEIIRKHPERFSPNAALRPVVQDGALPVAATVGGPAECLYLWQIDPIYPVAEVERSRVYPRITATIVENKIRVAAEKIGLTPDRLFDATRRIAEYESDPSEIPPASRLRSLEEKSGELLRELGRFVTPEGPAWLKKAESTLGGVLEKTLKNLREAELERVGLGKKRLERIAEAILPGGKPQERAHCIFQYMNLYGPDFVREILGALDPTTRGHLLLCLTTELQGDDAHGS
jgi:bacillithiol biosynthesis cysteine-adding enzyme BshC